MIDAKRQRGEVETLPSGSLRVRVYAGIDPVTRKRHYLTETIPPGPTAAKDAERTRFLPAQVDETRNPKTRATLTQLLDRYRDQDRRRSAGIPLQRRPEMPQALPRPQVHLVELGSKETECLDRPTCLLTRAC